MKKSFHRYYFLLATLFIVFQPTAHAEQFIVKLRPGQTHKTINEFTKIAGRKKTSHLLRTDDGSVFFSTPQIAESDAEKLRDNPKVEYVEPNRHYHAYSDEEVTLKPPVNDPNYSLNWNLRNFGLPGFTGQLGIEGADIHIEKLWQEGITGTKNVLIAVLDTGIQTDHPDLAKNIYTNPSEIPGNGIDDDQNGYVDDVHGWNVITDSGNSEDDAGHGTHCAGIIGAVGNNGIGTSGVVWNTSILPVKFLNKDGKGDTIGALKAIAYAKKMGAKILSNSWGGDPYSQALRDAIHDLNDAGIIFVAAAGNDHLNNDVEPEYPSTYEEPNVISVAGTDNRDRLMDMSHWGLKTVHVAAPGLMIYSTINNSGYEYFSGTSMATPHVSALAALVLSQEPLLTPEEVRTRLIETSDPSYELKRKIASGGRINAYNAIHNIVPDRGPSESQWKSEPYTIETPHPYFSKEVLVWTIQKPGAKWIRVHFKKIDSEQFDKVQLESSEGQVIEVLSGELLDYTSEPAHSDRITIRFKPDLSLEKWGFEIDRVDWIAE